MGRRFVGKTARMSGNQGRVVPVSAAAEAPSDAQLPSTPMASGGGDGDEFDVSLEWPDEEPGAAAARLTWPNAEDPDDAPRPPTVGGDPVAVPPKGRMPLLPAVAARLESIESSIAMLAIRVDALGATTNGVRSSLSDRLAEYADTVARLTRSQQDMLEEYHHGNERAVTELRRSVTESDDVVRRLEARVDELVTDVASLTEIARTLASESRSRFTPSDFGDEASGELGGQLGGLEGLADTISAIELQGRASASELAGLRDELAQLKRRVAVRAKAPAVLDEAQIEDLVVTLAEQLGSARLADEELARFAQAVVAQLAESLELVSEETAPARKEAAPARSRRRSP